ncbi:MAG: hypothetical protein JNM12_11310 [Alphaproteobacteria bacterium]|nr:hypothetical protein [Alphaproteobacteria bacterium]
MFIRAVSLAVTLALVAYMMVSVLGKNSKVDQAIDANPAVQEQKKALKSAGVNADDKDAVKKQLADEVKRLEEFQKQADQLPKGDPP